MVCFHFPEINHMISPRLAIAAAPRIIHLLSFLISASLSRLSNGRQIGKSISRAAGSTSGRVSPDVSNNCSRESLALEEADCVEQLREIVNNIVGFYAFLFLCSLV